MSFSLYSNIGSIILKTLCRDDPRFYLQDLASIKNMLLDCKLVEYIVYTSNIVYKIFESL